MLDSHWRRNLVLGICWGIFLQLSETHAESTPDRAEALQLRALHPKVQAERQSPLPVSSPVRLEGSATPQAEAPPLSKEKGSGVCPVAGCSHEVSLPAPEVSVKPTEILAANVEATLQPVHRIDENISDARESFYSKKLFLVMKKWPPENIEKQWEAARPVWIRGIKTEGNSTYIGSQKQILIHANLKRVSSLIQDFEAYPEFFHDLKYVRVTSRDGNKITTFWERYSPVFFLPNIKYEQVYIVDTTEKRVMIRYQLKSADSINYADGYVVLEAEGESTRLTAFDFFDAKWGILGGLAPGKIWHESFRNSLKDDIAFKTHAEHPDWSRDQIYRECDRVLELFPVAPIQYVDSPNWSQ